MLLRETLISKDNRIFSLIFNIFEFQKHITWLRNVLTIVLPCHEPLYETLDN